MTKTLLILLSWFLFFATALHINDGLAQQKKSTAKSKTAKKGSDTKTQEKKAVVNPPANSEVPSLLNQEELAEYKQKVTRMISFLEFALNTIGSDSSLTDDKEVIINKSYLKFFKDSKVQVEDDLVEGRTTITYKSIQSYLQDVDYFFKDAKFELNIDEITPFLSDKNNPYFVVTMTRYLKGINSNGDTIRNSKKRFVDINFGLKDKDLKIASIYSSKYNEEQDLKAWWEGLPEVWKQLFRKDMGKADTINFGQLKRILNTEVIDISKDSSITSIEPLNKLSRLKSLDLSYSKIEDLTPLRNLIYLETLNCSNTPVKSLEALKYSTELKDLNISSTRVSSLEPVRIFAKLTKIDLHETAVTDLQPLSKLTSLTELQASTLSLRNVSPLAELKNLSVLNISETEVDTISALASLDKLSFLNLSHTKVKSISPLSNLKQLAILMINNTEVSTLEDLKGLPALEKVYCDHTQISKEEAKQFMTTKTGTLVIYESDGMQQWWNDLSEAWRAVFKKYIPIGENPTKEQLAGIPNLTQIDISGIKEINNLEPLTIISNLKELHFNNTYVASLEPLKANINLQVLDFSETPVRTLEVLYLLKNLRRAAFDNTGIDSAQALHFKTEHPDCLVIYRTSELNAWWASVPEEWRDVFKDHLALDTPPTSIQLHQLAALDSIRIKDKSAIKQLDPLTALGDLRALEFTNTSVSNLEPLGKLSKLEILSIAKNPVKDLNPLKTLQHLRSLDFTNTGVSDLEPLKELKHLESLNFEGTHVKDLKSLEGLESLKVLDCATTSVGSLGPLEKISSLRSLKCYNTKLSGKKVEKFKKSHPDCTVVFY